MRKYFPIFGAALILICAVIHAFFTIKNHQSIITAVPLKIKLVFVCLFWGVVLLIGIICYLLIVKNIKNEGEIR